MQNTAKQKYPGSVAAYDSQPANKVRLVQDTQPSQPITWLRLILKGNYTPVEHRWGAHLPHIGL